MTGLKAQLQGTTGSDEELLSETRPVSAENLHIRELPCEIHMPLRIGHILDHGNLQWNGLAESVLGGCTHNACVFRISMLKGSP